MYILLVLAIVFMANAFFIRYIRSNRDNNLVRSYTELWFCSDDTDAQCDTGVTELDYTLATRGPFQRGGYGYIGDDRVHVKVQQVIIKLQEKAKDTLNYEPTIYVDVDGNGVFDPQLDDKLVKGFFSGKKIVFEDLNHSIRSNTPEDNQYKSTTRFLIVNDEREQEFTTLNLKDIEVEAVNLARKSEFVENSSSFADRSLFRYSDLVDISKEDFLATNSSFEDAGENKVTWPEGEYEIREDLIIPLNLEVEIEAGAEIRIGADKSVVSYSPIQFNGEADQRIIITNLDPEPYDTFAVIGKIGNDFGDVHINYTDFSGGSEGYINGAFISGMASFYRIPNTNISNSSFTGGAADDGLNVKYSNVYVTDSIFLENSADAFDGDFITGIITDNDFIDNGNDSLDFSGGDLFISYNDIQSSGDKCISVGEATKAEITRNRLDGCYIGIQVKDRSSATIYENLIIENELAGLDAYVKKFFFGEPSLEYYDNLILDNTDSVIGLVPLDQLGANEDKGNLDDFNNLEWLQDINDKL